MTMTWTDIVLVTVSLIAMFSPPATIGPAAAILARAPRAAQQRVAWLVARNYALVMIVTLVLGHAILATLGIATGALSLTGGAALINQGWPLMTRGDKAEAPAAPDANGNHSLNWDTLATVPLTFPITIGGGTVAVALAASDRYATVPDLLVLGAISLFVALIVALTFLLVLPLSKRLTVGAMDILVRVSGIILFALGAQLAVEGLVALVRHQWEKPSQVASITSLGPQAAEWGSLASIMMG